MQLWRWVGLLIGVDPELLPTGEAEAMRFADLVAATMGPPDADSRALTNALVHSPLETARNERDKKNLQKRVEFSKALCRELVGNEIADKLGLERTSWRLTLPLLKRLVSLAETVRGNVPGAHGAAILTGTLYWDRVVEVGLAGASVEFKLPERLAAA
jgi:hypothetical protein